MPPKQPPKGSAGKPERPTIELYMYSLNQEFPAEKGHAAFLERRSTTKPDVAHNLVNVHQVESQVFNRLRQDVNDWSVQWVSNEWIENHTKAAGVGIREEIDPMVNARLREEDFGGILFEPTSDRVYKLNRAGLSLFKELRERYQRGERDLSQMKIARFDEKEVADFVAFLHSAGLWQR
jgi:hypothetical protein